MDTRSMIHISCGNTQRTKTFGHLFRPLTCTALPPESDPMITT